MQKYWIERLPGMPPLPCSPAGYTRPDRVTATFIEDGYFVEFFEFPFDRDRTVALLFGPREFLIRSHPTFSTIQSLDQSCVVDFSYGNIFRTLRNFPESKAHYRKMKAQYEQKVADRLQLAALESDRDRFHFVQQRQPWVLKKVPDNLVAGYLGVTVARLRELKGG
jgi:hypothetical protein